MTAFASTTLRPGLLVSLKTSLTGNVQYSRATIEGEHITETGAARSAWETVRTVADPIEHEAGIKARGKARSVVTAVCAASSFGLLCPESAEDKLAEAIAEARRIAEDFNATATLSRISVFVITGRVARDDVEAVRAINSEVRQLLADMETGIRNLDVSAIREAANKTRELGAMLSPEAAAKVQTAIDTARATARAIVKAGETAGQAIDAEAIRKIAESRTAFLDLEEGADMKAPEAEARAIDLAPAEAPATGEEGAEAFQAPGEPGSLQAPNVAPVAPAISADDLEPVTIPAPAAATRLFEF